MRRAVISSLVLALTISAAALRAEERSAPWRTAVVCVSEPKDFNAAFIVSVQEKVLVSLASLPNADIREAASGETSLAERVITIHIRELRKESAAAGESGAERYIMKRIPPLHGISVSVKNNATGETAELSETVSGYDYAPKGNPYIERFASFFSPRPAAGKSAVPLLSKGYLSAYAAGELPLANYSSYSHGGGSLVLEGALSPYRWPDSFLGVQISFGAMSPTKGKLDPYYKFPVYLVGGYRAAITQKISVIPSLGAGVTLHRIHSRTYTNPAMTLQLRGLYEFSPGLCVFMMGGYSAFRDSAFTGQSVSASLGCQYATGFN